MPCEEGSEKAAVCRPEIDKKCKVENRDKAGTCLDLVLGVEMVPMGSIPEELMLKTALIRARLTF